MMHTEALARNCALYWVCNFNEIGFVCYVNIGDLRPFRFEVFRGIVINLLNDVNSAVNIIL